jgi:hypothetical protein
VTRTQKNPEHEAQQLKFRGRIYCSGL